MIRIPNRSGDVSDLDTESSRRFEQLGAQSFREVELSSYAESLKKTERFGEVRIRGNIIDLLGFLSLRLH